MCESPWSRIGDGSDDTQQPAYIIAQLGLNHNGRVACARQLIRQASAAGADGVSLPVYRTDAVISRQAEPVPQREEQIGDIAEDPRNLLGRCELALEAFDDLFELAREQGLDVVPAPRDRGSLDRLPPDKLHGLLVKAGDLSFPALLQACAATSFSLLLSTGLIQLEEIDDLIDSFSNREKTNDLILLYQACCYPARMEDLDLNTIATYKARYNHLAGFSDHTTSYLASQISVSLGADVLVKYLTMDRGADGPDHAISLEPEPFHEYVRGVRKAEEALGSGQKNMSERETELRPHLRRSLAVRHRVEQGQVVSGDDLTALRPAHGIPAHRREDVAGRPLSTTRRAGELLFPDDLPDEK